MPWPADTAGKSKVLVLQSSPLGDHSVSNHATKAFIDSYKAAFPDDTVDVLDLSKGLPPFTAARVQAKFALYGGPNGADGIEEYKQTEELISQLLSADKLVIAAPFWNFFVPDNLKLWIDHIVQPNKTFDAKTWAGLVTGKPAIILRAAAGAGIATPADHGLAYLYAVLKFIGFKDIRHLAFGGTADVANREKILADAASTAAEAAKTFSFDERAAPTAIELSQKADPTPAPEAPVKTSLGPKVLYISSSPMGEKSSTRKVVAGFLDAYRKAVPEATVTEIDLAALTARGELPPFTAVRVQAKFAKFAGKDAALAEDVAKEWAVSEAQIKLLEEADTVVFGVPLWNLAIPYTLSNYFHHVVQPGYTFNPANWAGLLPDSKKVFIAAAAGGASLASPLDHATPYLKTILGFIGLKDISIVHVNGGGDDKIEAATKTLTALAGLA